MSIKITGLQLAQDALRKELEKLQGGGYVLVGIHEDAEAPKGDLPSMATLGAIQHYGNEDIPARPWLDVGVEQGTKEYLETIEEGIASGKSQYQILDDVGSIATGYVQQYIRDFRTPANAASTIARKALKKDRSMVKQMRKEGYSNAEIQGAAGTHPLVDSGAMRDSVTWKIANAKPEEGI